MAKRIGTIFVSLLVSGFFLWLALRNQNLQDVGTNLRAANPFWFAASVCVVMVGFYARSTRWRGLVGFAIPPHRAYFIIGVTFMLNLLPFRAGEFARTLLATREGIPLVTAATSIVVERLLDVLIVVVLLLGAVSQLPTIDPAISNALLLFGVAGVVAFAILLALAKQPKLAYAILDWLEAHLPILERLPLRGILTNVLEGLQTLNSAERLIHAIVWTCLSWASSFVTFHLLHFALGTQTDQQVVYTLMGLTLASFSVAIPVTVAAIGPFEGAVVLAGEAVGADAARAVSLGVLFHLSAILGYAIGGIVGTVGLGLSLGDLVRESTKQKRKVQPTPTE